MEFVDDFRNFVAKQIVRGMLVICISFFIGAFADIQGGLSVVYFSLASAPALVIFGYGAAKLMAKSIEQASQGAPSMGKSFIFVAWEMTQLFGIFPFAFAVYLFFVRGLWGLTGIFEAWDWGILTESAIFLLLGYWLIVPVSRLTESFRLIDKLHASR